MQSLLVSGGFHNKTMNTNHASVKLYSHKRGPEGFHCETKAERMTTRSARTPGRGAPTCAGGPLVSQRVALTPYFPDPCIHPKSIFLFKLMMFIQVSNRLATREITPLRISAKQQIDFGFYQQASRISRSTSERNQQGSVGRGL